MGRFRAPEPAGSKYITPEGARRLRAELEQLWREERPRVTQAVAEAAAQGDRSENAEYTYGKRRLREIDRRVRFLRQRLDGMVIVAQPPSDPRRVFFGAWVELEAQDGARTRHRIVGPGRIRHGARLHQHGLAARARAAAASALDEEVTVAAPGGDRVYLIVAVEYGRRRSEAAPARCARLLPDDADVLELPGIVLVDVLGEQPPAIVQRGPVGVLADHRAEIRHADLEVAAEVHLVRLDDAAVRILDRPDHPRTAPRRVTCRLVALLNGASLRASSIESCEPYQ